MPITYQFLAGNRQSGPRRGRITTPHGTAETPAFMPVGTKATIKGMDPDLLADLGAEIVLGNTYHLHLRPGEDLIDRFGGLHKFMGWGGSTLTDSGGFQVFSLAGQRKITEEGVTFQSHLDGAKHMLTPENVVRIQQKLRSDIMMCLDECPPGMAERDDVARATALSNRWAKRAWNAYEASPGPGGLFGIVQGGRFLDLRAEAVAELSHMPFQGLAIGGVSVGEPEEIIEEVVRPTAPRLPTERPRYLMGVGRPKDIVMAVDAGIDMFDCVMPTRNARNGSLFTSQGVLTIKQARFIEDDRPLDPACPCPTCSRFSRAYLRHLYLSQEMLAPMLLTVHNLAFYLNLMQRIRESIAGGTWELFKTEFAVSYGALPQGA